MRTTTLILGAVLLVLAAGCQKPAEETPPSASEPGTAATEPAGSTAATASESETPAPSAAAAAPAGGETVLASQETNWKGIVAEVTEFRRKGNTLTAKVRFRNQGGVQAQPDIHYDEVYVMDLAAGKKYKVLEDEAGAYIAALRQNWKDRWYEDIDAGQSRLIWMKFPAPPADVKSVTLQVPGVPPFEDLPIQDS